MRFAKRGFDVWAAQSPLGRNTYVNMAYASTQEDFEMHVLSVPFQKIPAFDNVKVLHHLGFLLDSKWYFDPLDKALEHVQAQEQELLEKVAQRCITASPSVDSTLLVSRRRFILQAVGAKQTLEPLQQTCAIIRTPEEFSFNHTPMKSTLVRGMREEFEVYLDNETRLPKALRLGNALVCPWDIDHADGKVVANERPLNQEELIDEVFLSKMVRRTLRTVT